MHFMLLCSINETEWDRLPEARRDEIMQEYGTLLQELAQSGHLRAGAKLRPVATARTLRRKAGQVTVTDGPYAEAKEHIGGFHLLECRDQAEAMAIAGRIPSLRVGASVEVRPVDFLEPGP